VIKQVTACNSQIKQLRTVGLGKTNVTPLAYVFKRFLFNAIYFLNIIHIFTFLILHLIVQFVHCSTIKSF